jgi:hypothetical protein
MKPGAWPFTFWKRWNSLLGRLGAPADSTYIAPHWRGWPVSQPFAAVAILGEQHHASGSQESSEVALNLRFSSFVGPIDQA